MRRGGATESEVPCWTTDLPPKNTVFAHIDENAARNPARLHLNDALTTGELLSVWQSLDESHRAVLIVIAKGMAAQASLERHQDDR